MGGWKSRGWWRVSGKWRLREWWKVSRGGGWEGGGG